MAIKDLLKVENEFGEFIHYMRKAAGLSQGELAEKLSFNVTTVWKYEKGIRIPEDIYAFEQLLRQIVKEEIYEKRVKGILFSKRRRNRNSGKRLTLLQLYKSFINNLYFKIKRHPYFPFHRLDNLII